MAFKDTLKKMRESRAMTQSDLAAKIGVTTRTLQNYEMGKSYPKSQEVIMKLCAVFECEPNTFLAPEEEFLQEVTSRYGTSSARRAKSIIAQTDALFSGGELDEEDREAFMEAIMQIYFESKKKAKKFAPKKSR